MDLHKYFPLDQDPREGQVIAITKSIEMFDKGFKTVVVEAPVGSGKSAIALALANYYGNSHILTPRKALQDQYYRDFKKMVVMMKGRNSYPCLPPANTGNIRLTSLAAKIAEEYPSLDYAQASQIIGKGKSPYFKGPSCAEGPCLKDDATKETCKETQTCPYNMAVNWAIQNDHVVHNLHSFIFQAYFAGHFDQRELLVVDEAHDLEDIVRDFVTKVMVIRAIGLEYPKGDDFDEWVTFFSAPAMKPPEGTLEREEYETALANFTKYRMKNFVVDADEKYGLMPKTVFKFIPKHVGNAAETFMLNFGKRRLLMSGTIYDKDYFCFRNGIDPAETAFIRIDSTFPVAARPIIMKDKYLTDNSFREWEKSYPTILKNIRFIFKQIPEARGLIHAPSYEIGERMARDLADTGRVLSHAPETFQKTLEWFFEDSPNNAVLISPICQQGVDFKYDRARFQIIVRVPYPNASDVFVKEMLRGDAAWYNYKTLITFGQMLGRPMRADDDHGYTILLDSRFKRFISANRRWLPTDVLASIKTKD